MAGNRVWRNDALENMDDQEYQAYLSKKQDYAKANQIAPNVQRSINESKPVGLGEEPSPLDVMKERIKQRGPGLDFGALTSPTPGARETSPEAARESFRKGRDLTDEELQKIQALRKLRGD